MTAYEWLGLSAGPARSCALTIGSAHAALRVLGFAVYLFVVAVFVTRF